MTVLPPNAGSGVFARKCVDQALRALKMTGSPKKKHKSGPEMLGNGTPCFHRDWFNAGLAVPGENLKSARIECIIRIFAQYCISWGDIF